MAQERTTNLDLVLPIQADDVLVQDINGNMTKIDTFAGQTNQALLTKAYGASLSFSSNQIVRITYTDSKQTIMCGFANGIAGHLLISSGKCYHYGDGTITAFADTNNKYIYLQSTAFAWAQMDIVSDRPITATTASATGGTAITVEQLALKSDIKYKTVTKTVSIPAGTSTEQEYIVDFTNDITVDYMLVNVTVGLYMLPYVVGDNVKTQAFSYSRSERKLVIKNRSTAWNNMKLVAVFTKLE